MSEENNAPPTPNVNDPTLMSVEEREKVVALLNEKIPGGGKCPVCPTGSFTLGNHYVTPTVLNPNQGVFLGGANYPSVLLICGDCGHMRFHNALILGVLDSGA